MLGKLIKVSNEDTRKTSITSFWRHQNDVNNFVLVFIVNFEQISQLFLMFLLLILCMYFFSGKVSIIQIEKQYSVPPFRLRNQSF